MKTKQQKQREALDRLIANLPEDLSKITDSQKTEYNRLKESLGEKGRLR